MWLKSELLFVCFSIDPLSVLVLIFFSFLAFCLLLPGQIKDSFVQKNLLHPSPLLGPGLQ